MPERPELDYLQSKLDPALAGQTIDRVTVHDPVVVRVAVEGTAPALLAGRRITGVRRRGHFLLFGLHGAPPLELAIHAMLAGRLTLDAPGQGRRGHTKVTLHLSDGRELRYRDPKQMGKVYVLDPAQREQIPRLGAVGVDVLGPGFTPEAFAALARKRRDQVKLFLLDKGALDALGNAYADEALHRAGVHPKARVRELSTAQLEALHAGIVAVLTEAAAEVERRQPPLDEKVRDFLQVRNRKGEPCPVCGDTVRVVGVRGHDAFFCPTCQPDHKGRGFVRWRSPAT